MSSLEIAEVTGKEHKNVMRDIQTLLSQGVDKLNFERISYKDSMNKLEMLINSPTRVSLFLLLDTIQF